MVILRCSIAAADPIKLQPVGVTASGTYSSFTPAMAVDGSSSTYWNAGGYAPQWIQLDLGRPVSVRKMRVQYAPSPGGAQQGNIQVSANGTTWLPAYTWNQSVADLQWIDFDGDNPTYSYKGGNVRYVRITTTSSTSWIAIREIELYGGVEYFGYFRDSSADVKKPSCTGTCDYMVDTSAAGANLTWVGGNVQSDLIAKLGEAQTNGVKALVDLDYLLWSGSPLTPVAGQMTVWSNLKTAINSGGYAGVIAGFFIADEAYLRGARQTDLSAIVSQIKADFPTKPVSVSLYASDLQNPTVVNATTLSIYDWVGFDCYGTFSGGCGGYSIASLIGQLRALLSNNQRTFAFPLSAVWSGSTYATSNVATWDSEITTHDNPYLDAMLADSKFIGMFPFLWQNFNTTYGAAGIPWLAERMYTMATTLIPPLRTNGFVYAPSGLAFTNGTARSAGSDFADSTGWSATRSEFRTVHYADVNGDGRADVCGRASTGVVCALASSLGTGNFGSASSWATVMTDASGWGPDQYGSTMMLGDINGDGQADLCGRASDGIYCATSTGSSFTGWTQWTATFTDATSWGSNVGYYGTIRLADVNGDGRADVCGRAAYGITCALSNGSTAFATASGWSTSLSDSAGWLPEQYSTTLSFPDVDGDGAADVCVRAPSGLTCAKSNRTSYFGTFSSWSGSFSDTGGWNTIPAYYKSLSYADLNGDGRSDVCGRGSDGVYCALSSGGAFSVPYKWFSGFTDASGWNSDQYGSTLQIADITGNRLADVCARGSGGLVCAGAP